MVSITTKIFYNRCEVIKFFVFLLEYLDRFLNSDNYIDYPEDGFTWEKTEKDGSILKTSKEAKRASIKHYDFEQENFRMFWKRFVQWHRHWWC